MATEFLSCPRCKGEMVQGFVPDYYSHAANFVAQWHEGQPKKSFWTRTKTPSTKGTPIGAFRCRQCGFLELYADPKFTAQ